MKKTNRTAAPAAGITDLESLRRHLQAAIEVEHATIPPYFTAWMSIPTGDNPVAADIIRTVMLEEMLHMVLAANLLNAVGGRPSLTHPGFVRDYPHTLPFSGMKFKISLEKFSRSAIQTFMKIEHPEPKDAKPEPDRFQTIGQFYDAVEEAITRLCKKHGEANVFCGDAARQIGPDDYYGSGRVVVVTNRKTALLAIREIVEQGEGAKHSIFDGDHNIHGSGEEVAHYYRFDQILKKKLYAPGDTPTTGPTGAKFPVDFSQVYPIQSNPRIDSYAPGSQIRNALEAFASGYGRMLGMLEHAFNGEPASMKEAIAGMFVVKNLALSLMRIPSGKGDGSTVGLSFEQRQPTPEQIDNIITSHADVFRKPGVLSVRPGYKRHGNWISGQRAIVATVEKDATPPPALPPSVQGIPVQPVEASPREHAFFRNKPLYQKLKAAGRPEHGDAEHPYLRDAQTGEQVHYERFKKVSVPYTPPDVVKLLPVTDTMTLNCAVSPDAGWSQLQGFLTGVKNEMTVGMYDFTSAHVLDGVRTAMGKKAKLSLVLDHPSLNKTADQTDEETYEELRKALSSRLDFAWAAAGDDRMVSKAIFPTSYHIKVAVKDGASFWLSSGNWNNSNQPDVDPFTSTDPAKLDAIVRDSDRDWHITVQHGGLSKTFQAYLQHDLQVATSLQDGDALDDAKFLHPDPAGEAKVPKTYFRPKTFRNVKVKITPLLTPDTITGDYAAAIKELLLSAKSKLYIQTQYIEPPRAGAEGVEAFRALIAAVAAKIQAGLDVRIICSEYEGKWVEMVQDAGIPATHMKIQNNLHNKGIVVDSSVVALGSQNWSADGALFNRDASLIVYDADVAQYYEQVFLHDWENMAVQKMPHD